MPYLHPKILFGSLNRNYFVEKSSASLEAFLGLESKHIEGKDFFSFLSTTNPAHLIAHIKNNLSHKLSWQGELNFTAHNGQLLWADVHLDVSNDKINFSAFETTEQKMIQSSVQENLRFQEVLMKEAPVGFLLASPSGESQYMNSKWLELSGLSRMQALGHGWLKAVHPEDRKMVEEYWEGVVKGSADSLEYRYLKPDGGISYVLARSCIIEGRDILRIEDDHTQIKEQQRLLEAQKFKLQENARLSAMATLASALAHELGNPLAIISCYVDDIESNPDLEGEEKKKMFAPIHRNLNRIEEIVRSVKILSEETIEQDLAGIDLSRIQMEVEDKLSKDFVAKSITLNWSFKDLPLVQGRFGELVQVFTILLSNAAHALETSSLKEILVTAKVEEKFIQISIEDSGPGIPLEDASQIFDPFFTTKDPGKGTGLGLSIAKKFMLSMAGDLWLNSLSPTIFTLTLPLADERSSYERD